MWSNQNVVIMGDHTEQKWTLKTRLLTVKPMVFWPVHVHIHSWQTSKNPSELVSPFPELCGSMIWRKREKITLKYNVN